MTVTDDYIVVPWRPEQVTHLNRRQSGGRFTAYVCPRHGHTPLFATRFGLICAVVGRRGCPCGYRQEWVRSSDLQAW